MNEPTLSHNPYSCCVFSSVSWMVESFCSGTRVLLHLHENIPDPLEFDLLEQNLIVFWHFGLKSVNILSVFQLLAPFLHFLPLFSSSLFSQLSQFFTDPCASSPCLHGNCSRSDGGEEEEPSYTCECSEGYEGERCDQILLDLPPADWDPATPSAPERVTPAASTTTAATQPPTTVPTTTTTEAAPTLPSWQPKPGQRLLVVPWEADRVRTHPLNRSVDGFRWRNARRAHAVCVSGDGGPPLFEPWALWADVRNSDAVRGGAWRKRCEVRTHFLTPDVDLYGRKSPFLSNLAHFTSSALFYVKAVI